MSNNQVQSNCGYGNAASWGGVTPFGYEATMSNNQFQSIRGDGNAGSWGGVAQDLRVESTIGDAPLGEAEFVAEMSRLESVMFALITKQKGDGRLSAMARTQIELGVMAAIKAAHK